MKILLFILLFISLEANITTTKKELLSTQKNISLMNEKLKLLAKKIQKQQRYINALNKQIIILNNQINLLKNELKNSKKKLSNLVDLKKGYEEKLNTTQEEITNFLSENYFNSILKPQNVNDLINKEITNKILKKYSQKIANILNKNRTIQYKINQIDKKIQTILNIQKEFLNKKEKLKKLITTQQIELKTLKNKKIEYKQKLEALLKKQKNLQKKLEELKVVSNKPLSTYKVKKYGSVYIKPKISRYKGKKTIPPIKGKIIKKFGSYIDPIYHIKIFNPSITIKPYRKNAKVRAILSGKIIYIGETSFNKKIIVIKHRHNLFSIYANLDKISPILKKGYFVKRGQIIARVNNSLDFEVTYKEKPINPLKVINLK